MNIIKNLFLSLLLAIGSLSLGSYQGGSTSTDVAQISEPNTPGTVIVGENSVWNHCPSEELPHAICGQHESSDLSCPRHSSALTVAPESSGVTSNELGGQKPFYQKDEDVYLAHKNLFERFMVYKRESDIVAAQLRDVALALKNSRLVVEIKELENKQSELIKLSKQLQEACDLFNKKMFVLEACSAVNKESSLKKAVITDRESIQLRSCIADRVQEPEQSGGGAAQAYSSLRNELAILNKVCKKISKPIRDMGASDKAFEKARAKREASEKAKQLEQERSSDDDEVDELFDGPPGGACASCCLGKNEDVVIDKTVEDTNVGMAKIAEMLGRECQQERVAKNQSVILASQKEEEIRRAAEIAVLRKYQENLAEISQSTSDDRPTVVDLPMFVNRLTFAELLRERDARVARLEAILQEQEESKSQTWYNCISKCFGCC